jgi:integrase
VSAFNRYNHSDTFIDRWLRFSVNLDSEELKYKVMVLLDVFSGLRLGELMGLNWANIDMECNSVEVVRASQYLRGMGTFEKKPKNETSVRKITIPAPVIALLKEYRKEWLAQKVSCGDL